MVYAFVLAAGLDLCPRKRSTTGEIRADHGNVAF
jgi:hypothetical protein